MTNVAELEALKTRIESLHEGVTVTWDPALRVVQVLLPPREDGDVDRGVLVHFDDANGMRDLVRIVAWELVNVAFPHNPDRPQHDEARDA